MGWESFVGGGLTVGVVIFGLSSWLGKVWANRILEKDKIKYKIQIDTLMQDLRTKDSKELFVHKVQFEKEFEVYKDLWERVLCLGRAGKQFRNLQIDKPKPLVEVCEDYAKAYNVLSDTVFANRPFYAPGIFDLCKKLLHAAVVIDRSIHRQKILEKKSDCSDKIASKIFEMENQIDENLDKINALVGEICNAIRTRIWSTDRTGWDRNSDDSQPSQI